ncbi:MAG: lysylphosphatidylglycerol synthase transmembrane domain-containing protein, partial [Bacteroidota bacterium]
EITRCGTLARYSKTPFNSVAGTVVAERVFDVVSLLILIFLTVVVQFSLMKDFLYLYVYSPLLELVRGNMMLLVILGIAGVAAFLLLLKYFMGVNSSTPGLPGKIKRQLLGFVKGLLSLTKVRGKVVFFLLSIGIWGLYYLTVYLCFFALDGTSHLGVAAGFTLLALGSLGIVAPVPGGIGTYHFITIATLTELYFVSSEAATSYAYISHAAQMVIIIILGGFSWLALTFRKRETSLKQERAVVTES